MNDLPWGDIALNVVAVTAAIIVFIGLIMAAAIKIQNQSIIDIFWGPGFVVAAVVSYLVSSGSGGDDTRRLVVLALTSVWGLRLGLYIGNRNRGHGQDKRYTALMRHQQGSLIGFLVRKIYGLQGALMIVISIPVQLAMYESEPLGVIGAIGFAIWLIGFLFEAVGDWQLARFKADPANAGKIMDRGLWAWTRHPNYFGDAAVWTGLFVLALGSAWGLLTIVSPIIMTKLLVSFSGKALLERGMRRSKGEAYDAYVAKTSGFFPLPPKRQPSGAGTAS
jgi:steroid 5-alpha reductase family enzyme